LKKDDFGVLTKDQEATAASASIPAAAGSSIDVQWNTWPESHKGPVITYLANCNGDCAAVKKADLKFFKIQADGLKDGSSPPGKWASDDLIGESSPPCERKAIN
jgi:hypothetical protein